MWYNRIVTFILRSPLHSIISSGIMLVQYAGQKSGKIFRVPVTYVPYKGDLLVVSFKDRVWWRNLRTLDQVQVRLRGKNVLFRPIVHEDDSVVAEFLSQYLSQRPNYGRFFDVRFDENNNEFNAEDLLR
ncbi:MAG: hypothetical protein CUN55_15345, partial [Phototrophicales bacterium]